MREHWRLQRRVRPGGRGCGGQALGETLGAPSPPQHCLSAPLRRSPGLQSCAAVPPSWVVEGREQQPAAQRVPAVVVLSPLAEVEVLAGAPAAVGCHCQLMLFHWLPPKVLPVLWPVLPPCCLPHCSALMQGQEVGQGELEPDWLAPPWRPHHGG
jgi:hypothetical protein